MVLTTAGLLCGVTAAPGAQDPTGGLTYTCPLPGGQRQLGVAIAAAFPQQVTVGEPIAPGEAAVTVALPRDSIAPEVNSIAGTARLSTTVVQGDTSVPAEWSDLQVPATPVPETGDPVLTAAGPVGSVTVDKAGDVRFLAGDLGLELILSTSDGSTTTVPTTCTLDPDQNATLAMVAVPEPATAPGSSPAESTPTGDTEEGGIRVAPAPAAAEPGAAEIPPECGQIAIPPGGRAGCAYVTGYSNVRKLNASIKVEPGLTNVAVVPPRSIPDPPLLIADNPANLVGGRFPEMTGSFLVFGFMPIRAKLDLIQVGPMNIHTEGRRLVPLTFTVRAESKLQARIRDVTVNGVPLDVGPNCETVEPIDAVLNGGTPDYVNILRGGPLSGFVEIPAFTGCGVTEDLDPLITGTVSGQNNFIRVVQGNVCVPIDPRSPCPPAIPQVPVPGS